MGEAAFDKDLSIVGILIAAPGAGLLWLRFSVFLKEIIYGFIIVFITALCYIFNNS